MQSQPSIHSLSRGKGGFGKDAEIRTHQALHEAKPIECPKGDRDNKSEFYFKNILFLQTEKSLALRQDSFAFLPWILYAINAIIRIVIRNIEKCTKLL